jgi:predicted CoA-substrate-specific enzyme activase
LKDTFAYMGIDVGSISTNIVLIDSEGNVIYDLYDRSEGFPIRSIQKSFSSTQKDIDSEWQIKGVCTTGSARHLIGSVVGADIVKNEIMAHARAALHLYPDTRTIFEIGGQDSKITIIRNGFVVDFAMNLVCAAGTGSFLDAQARRLNISIEELSERAVHSKNPTSIAGRCTVFAETDMIHKQQLGHNQDDILMGLCHAMVRNYLSNVCRGKEISPPVVLQGGISSNKGIRRAFKEALQTEIIIPPYNMVMGAYGAALIASQAEIKETKFRGFGISSHPIITTSFQCKDCINCCEIVEIKDRGTVIGRSGGRCGKW